jgi:hypothetical protein
LWLAEQGSSHNGGQEAEKKASLFDYLENIPILEDRYLCSSSNVKSLTEVTTVMLQLHTPFPFLLCSEIETNGQRPNTPGI